MWWVSKQPFRWLSLSLSLDKWVYLQQERLVVLGRPVVRFRLRGQLSLAILQMRSDQVHLDERPEHARLDHPLERVGRDHCTKMRREDGKGWVIGHGSYRGLNLPLTVTLCSPVLESVDRSICTEISPTLSSGFCESDELDGGGGGGRDGNRDYIFDKTNSGSLALVFRMSKEYVWFVVRYGYSLWMNTLPTIPGATFLALRWRCNYSIYYTNNAHARCAWTAYMWGTSNTNAVYTVWLEAFCGCFAWYVWCVFCEYISRMLYFAITCECIQNRTASILREKRKHNRWKGGSTEQKVTNKFFQAKPNASRTLSICWWTKPGCK